jgi:hypothetical protein
LGSAIRGWLESTEVQARGDRLERGISRYTQRYDVNVERPGIPYFLLHSLAHALMEQIVLECGYPLSSLKERVYAFAAPRSDMPDRFGLLIYTAGAGAQGTLGGLVEIAGRIPDILLAALDGGLNRSTQHFILNGKDGVYGDESRISSRFHCGREGGVVGSLAKRGVAESDWASVSQSVYWV